MTFYLMAPDGSGLNTDEEASQIVQLTTLDVEAMFHSMCEGSGFRVYGLGFIIHTETVATAQYRHATYC